MRTTKGELQWSFNALAAKLGKNTGPAYRREGERTLGNVGTWVLDHSIYGGYVIEEISNEGGGVIQPFGSTRRTMGEMDSAMRFALRALELK